MQRSGWKFHIRPTEDNSRAETQGVVLGVLLTVASMSLIWLMGSLIFY